MPIPNYMALYPSQIQPPAAAPYECFGTLVRSVLASALTWTTRLAPCDALRLVECLLACRAPPGPGGVHDVRRYMLEAALPLSTAAIEHLVGGAGGASGSGPSNPSSASGPSSSSGASGPSGPADSASSGPDPLEVHLRAVAAALRWVCRGPAATPAAPLAPGVGDLRHIAVQALVPMLALLPHGKAPSPLSSLPSPPSQPALPSLPVAAQSPALSPASFTLAPTFTTAFTFTLVPIYFGSLRGSLRPIPTPCACFLHAHLLRSVTYLALAGCSPLVEAMLYELHHSPPT